MGCSAEQTRRNAKNSTGPRSARGKAIAAKNATRHGLLSQKPPLLQSEDLETFQGLVQSLVDHYEPEGPIEWHLVNQVAMGIQRQYRLWQAEIVMTGDQDIVQPEPRYPQDYHVERDESISEDWGPEHPRVLQLERKILTQALEWLHPENVPQKSRNRYFQEEWESWIDTIRRQMDTLLAYSLQKNYPEFLLASARIAGMGGDSILFGKRLEWFRTFFKRSNPALAKLHDFEIIVSMDSCTPTPEYCRGSLIDIRSACEKRLDAIKCLEAKRREEEIQYQQAFEQQKLLSGPSIPNCPEILMRYEKHINQQLNDSLKKLERLKNQRHS